MVHAYSTSAEVGANIERMLHHANGRWSTDCERCHKPVEILGAPDGRGKVELERAGRFLETFGWTRLHRKNAGYRVEWWCPDCVAQVKSAGAKTLGRSNAGLDMRPSTGTKKGA